MSDTEEVLSPSIGLLSPSTFGKSSSKTRSYRDWATEEVHAAEEQRARGTLQLLEAELAKPGKQNDAGLARKIAKIRHKLWSFTLKKSAIEGTSTAYQRALAFAENRDQAGLWVECAVVYISFGAHAGALDLLNRIDEEFPTYVHRGRVLQLRASLWLMQGRYDDCIKCFRCERGQGEKERERVDGRIAMCVSVDGAVLFLQQGHHECVLCVCAYAVHEEMHGPVCGFASD